MVVLVVEVPTDITITLQALVVREQPMKATMVVRVMLRPLTTAAAEAVAQAAQEAMQKTGLSQFTQERVVPDWIAPSRVLLLAEVEEVEGDTATVMVGRVLRLTAAGTAAPMMPDLQMEPPTQVAAAVV
jgi:hypothetical protein